MKCPRGVDIQYNWGFDINHEGHKGYFSPLTELTENTEENHPRTKTLSHKARKTSVSLDSSEPVEGRVPFDLGSWPCPPW